MIRRPTLTITGCILSQIINGYAHQRKKARGKNYVRNAKARCSSVLIYKPQAGEIVPVDRIEWRNLKNSRKGTP